MHFSHGNEIWLLTVEVSKMFQTKIAKLTLARIPL
jgi:hypothetical protein